MLNKISQNILRICKIWDLIREKHEILFLVGLYEKKVYLKADESHLLARILPESYQARGCLAVEANSGSPYKVLVTICWLLPVLLVTVWA